MNKICFCYCFAQTRLDLQADLERPKDFTKAKLVSSQLPFEKFWRRYHRQIVKPYKKLRQRFEMQEQLSFVSDVTAERFQQLVRSEEYETVILFSHCVDGGEPSEMIEFYDRIVPSAEVAGWITPDMNKHFDFSICRPITLRTKLEEQKRRQFVVINWEWEVNLYECLLLYRRILTTVCANPDIGYARCVANTIKQFL